MKDRARVFAVSAVLSAALGSVPAAIADEPPAPAVRVLTTARNYGELTLCG